MFATMDYIMSEIPGKSHGYLWPLAGLPFAALPIELGGASPLVTVAENGHLATMALVGMVLQDGSTEMGRGHVLMDAPIDYVMSELTRRQHGYLSPSVGLPFASLLNEPGA